MGHKIDFSENHIEGVLLHPLSIKSSEKGDVLHVMRNFDEGFAGFGEAYFSSIQSETVKAWKRHREMILNLVVPFGEIGFVW